MQIDFGSAFDRVNHQGILYKLCPVCSGVSVLYNSFYQTVHSTLWCQECSRAVLWARYCSSCTYWSCFPVWKICWSVMSMTIRLWLLCQHQAIVFQYQSPWSVTSSVLVSGVSLIKLNATKINNMIVSRSRTMHPQPPQIINSETVLKESDNLDILGCPRWPLRTSSLGFQSSFSMTW